MTVGTQQSKAEDNLTDLLTPQQEFYLLFLEKAPPNVLAFLVRHEQPPYEKAQQPAENVQYWQEMRRPPTDYDDRFSRKQKRSFALSGFRPAEVNAFPKDYNPRTINELLSYDISADEAARAPVPTVGNLRRMKDLQSRPYEVNPEELSMLDNAFYSDAESEKFCNWLNAMANYRIKTPYALSHPQP